MTHATIAADRLRSEIHPKVQVARDETPHPPRGFHVTPQGAADGDGSVARPIDLKTALSKHSPARPGDTIWVHGGTYRGVFDSVLEGTAQAPIVVRQYPGEHATIDSGPSPREALLALGKWTWFWGLEVTSSELQRESQETGPWPRDLHRGGGVTARGGHLKFINMVVHDLSGGFGVWAESVGTEVYGSLVYYNGWYAPDRGHGHGIYTQNAGPDVRAIRDNIIFDQFSHGIHAYGSARAYLDEIVLEGNVAFNNGSLAGDFARDILLGGGRLAQHPVLRFNATYGGAQTNVGYAAGCAQGLVEHNYFVGTAFVLANCDPIVRDNVFVSRDDATPEEQRRPSNEYFYKQNPDGVAVRIRPSEYERGRAHVIVYNWANRDRVAVDLGAVCTSAAAEYHVQNAQNFFGPAVAAGHCGNGTVTLPLTGLTPAVPVGAVRGAPGPTAPEFAVFVVLSGAAAVEATAH